MSNDARVRHNSLEPGVIETLHPTRRALATVREVGVPSFPFLRIDASCASVNRDSFRSKTPLAARDFKLDFSSFRGSVQQRRIRLAKHQRAAGASIARKNAVTLAVRKGVIGLPWLSQMLLTKSMAPWLTQSTGK
jgi:hypothetical protein